MIVATDIELRAGARLLLESASFQVAAGDRIGLVGRNGAGKTTLAKVLAGQAQPAAGSVRRSGTVGYLPQDQRTGDLDTLAIDRVQSARGLDQLRADLRAAEAQMAATDSGAAAEAIRRYGRLEERLAVLGGYAAESQAASITASLGLPDRVLHQPLQTLSGGQRRRIELARILFSGSETMLLDEPTNHLDADSVAWLREHLKSYRGGLVVISHDVALLGDVVNKVFYLDAQRACLDAYNLGWQAYLQQRETDERRRGRERANAGRQAGALMAQADKMRAKATKARAAQNMQRRAERMLAGVQAERTADKVARLRFAVPAPCGRTPLTATGLSKSYGSTEVFSGIDVAVDRGAGWSCSDSTARERRPCSGCWPGWKLRIPEKSPLGTASASDITPKSTKHWKRTELSWQTCAAPHLTLPNRSSARSWGHSCSPAMTWKSPLACFPAARRQGWRWPFSWYPAPTCCCSTSRPTTWILPAGKRFSAR
jgi:ATPase subunit of ABC transporter with duplicated ATPase domains